MVTLFQALSWSGLYLSHLWTFTLTTYLLIAWFYHSCNPISINWTLNCFVYHIVILTPYMDCIIYYTLIDSQRYIKYIDICWALFFFSSVYTIVSSGLLVNWNTINSLISPCLNDIYFIMITWYMLFYCSSDPNVYLYTHWNCVILACVYSILFKNILNLIKQIQHKMSIIAFIKNATDIQRCIKNHRDQI